MVSPRRQPVHKKYFVRLTPEQRASLEEQIRTGAAPALTQLHARILLKADTAEGAPAWPDKQIAEAFEVSVPTVERVRKQFVASGFDAAISRKPTTRPSQRKLDGAQEAQLIAIACSPPPKGRARWSVRLLAKRLVELEVVDSIGREAVREVLKKTSLSRG
jgi:transposase